MLFRSFIVLAKLICLFVISDCATFEPEVEDSLRDSLMATYDKEVRPSHTVVIEVSMSLLSINDLDTKSQTFSTTAFFIMRWDDSRLSWNSTAYGDVDALFFNPKDIWIPTVLISNEVNQINVINNEYVPVRAWENGQMEWNPPLLIHTSCDMDISFYPFDSQKCSISMRTWAYYIEEVSLIADYIDDSEYSPNGEWVLQTFSVARTEEKRHGDDYSTLTFDFSLKRRPGHYVLNAIIPSILISLLGPVVFLLPSESGEKVSYIITVFLAYAVLLTLIVDQLPSSSQTTSGISVYLTLVTVIGAIIVILAIKILDIHHRDEKEEKPSWIIKTVKIMEIVMCRRKREKETRKIRISPVMEREATREINSITPRTDNNGLVFPELPRNHHVEEKSWMEIAKIFDDFFFYSTLLFTVVLGVLFLLSLLIHYWIT